MTEARELSARDRGVLLGDGIFETIRLEPGRALRLDAHLDRLFLGVEITGITPSESRAQLRERALEHAARAERPLALRITITRGEGPRGLDPAGAGPTRTLFDARAYEPWPRAIDVEWARAPRVPAACMDPRFKATSAMPAILARRSVRAREGLQRAIDGQLVSGLSSNVYLVRGARLETPSLASGCLPGVTRAAILARARALGLEPVERRVEPSELEDADEVLLSNALMGVVGVSTIDGRARRLGPVAARLDAEISR